mgnify:CR=1 FL=1
MRTRWLALLALAAACRGGDGRMPLVVYSPHGTDMLREVERRFEARYPSIDVQMLDMGSQEALDRVRTERANPQADVWFGAPSPLFAAAAAEGLLARYVPTWASALPADARDPGGAWHGTYLTPEVLAFNARRVPPDRAPHDWDDLLDPRWRDQIILRDPLASGTMRTIFGMILLRSLRATGDTAQGWAWLRRLDAQTREYVASPALLYDKLARGEGAVTMWTLPDIETLVQRGLPLDYRLPRSGTPLVVDGIAIVRGTRHPEAARIFVEFVGSLPEEIWAARAFARLPARRDVPSDSLPPRLRAALAQLVVEPMDWATLERQGAAWMRYWDEHVRGQGRRQ